VVRVDLDKDLTGWRPEKGRTDKYGELIEDGIYNQRDFDRQLILEMRTQLVARKVTEFLKGTDRFAKTIIFCEDIDHAERMRQALDQFGTPVEIVKLSGGREQYLNAIRWRQHCMNPQRNRTSAASWRIAGFLPPQRGRICQPRATPWVGSCKESSALKGRNKRRTHAITPFQGLGIPIGLPTQGVALG